MKIEVMKTLKANPNELTRGVIEDFLAESGVSAGTVVDIEVFDSSRDSAVELTVTEERDV